MEDRPHLPFFTASRPATADDVPENEYKFDPAKNEEASAEDLEIANKETNLYRAITKGLTPKELRDRVYILRSDIHQATLELEQKKREYEIADRTPGYIYQQVKDIELPEFEVPQVVDDEEDSQFQLIFQALSDEMREENENYKRRVSALIHKGNKVVCFGLRLNRLRLLFKHLIHRLGRLHVCWQREVLLEQSAVLFTHDNIAIATIGVRHLIGKVDLEMLQYLDINRDVLVQLFDHFFPTATTYDTLDQADKATANYVADTILGYLKPATCLHHKRHKRREHEEMLRAEVREMDKEIAAARRPDRKRRNPPKSRRIQQRYKKRCLRLAREAASKNST